MAFKVVNEEFIFYFYQLIEEKSSYRNTFNITEANIILSVTQKFINSNQVSIYSKLGELKKEA